MWQKITIIGVGIFLGLSKQKVVKVLEIALKILKNLLEIIGLITQHNPNPYFGLFNNFISLEDVNAPLGLGSPMQVSSMLKFDSNGIDGSLTIWATPQIDSAYTQAVFHDLFFLPIPYCTVEHLYWGNILELVSSSSKTSQSDSNDYFLGSRQEKSNPHQNIFLYQ